MYHIYILYIMYYIYVLYLKGPPRWFALCELVPNWYTIFLPDPIDQSEINDLTRLSNAKSTMLRCIVKFVHICAERWVIFFFSPNVATSKGTERMDWVGRTNVQIVRELVFTGCSGWVKKCAPFPGAGCSLAFACAKKTEFIYIHIMCVRLYACVYVCVYINRYKCVHTQIVRELVFTGHSGRVNKCAFSGAGCSLASASNDATVRIHALPGESHVTLHGESS